MLPGMVRGCGFPAAPHHTPLHRYGHSTHVHNASVNSHIQPDWYAKSPSGHQVTLLSFNLESTVIKARTSHAKERGHDLHQKLSAVAIAGTMVVTGASMATVPAMAADKAPAPVTATTQSKLITGYTTSTDQWGTKLFFRKNIVPNAKGAVVIVHGAAEHSGRYDYLAKRLNEAGYSTYRFDHRGHGRSASPYVDNAIPRGNIDDWSNLVNDVHQFVQIAHSENAGKKVFLFGHSMGSFAVQSYGAKYPGTVAGIVSNGGGIAVNPWGPDTEGPKKVTAHDLTDAEKNASPTISQLLPMDKLTSFNGVCTDQAVIDNYKKDPLNNKYMSLGMVKQMGVAQVYNTFNAPSFTEPTLIMHGANDGIVPSYFDVNWYNAIGSKDKKIIEWQGLMHETINEPVKDQVDDAIINWVNAHNK